MKKTFILMSGLLAFSVTHAVTSVQSKDTPVLLVHGFMTYDATSIDCASFWKPIRNELAAQGFTNVKTVTYYKDSTNCDVNLAKLYPNTGRDSTWRQLGGSLSNYVFDNYTRFGQKVDLLGHSMGGLVIRSAIQGGNESRVGFKNILVEDAVTIATPHKGTPFASLCINDQCKSLSPNNPDFAWLALQPKPWSMIPVDWSVQASNMDALTSVDSGLAMGVDANHKTIFPGLSHNAQVSNKAAISYAVKSLGTIDQ